MKRDFAGVREPLKDVSRLHEGRKDPKRASAASSPSLSNATAKGALDMYTSIIASDMFTLRGSRFDIRSLLSRAVRMLAPEQYRPALEGAQL